jgi:type III secretion system FlhB-like substrate exporter
MKPTYNKLVLRKTETEKQTEATIQTIRTKSRNPKVLLRAAAVIIPLVALSYLSISQQESINNVYTQMAAFNPFTQIKIAEEIIETNAEQTLAIEAVEEMLIIEEEKEEVPATIPQKTYYIIAGAFAEQKNANRMLNKLNNSNYNAEILEGGYLLRVSYDSFYNRENAVLALNKIKQRNPDAWLFTK